jgi:predicted ester cyclase
MAMPITSVPWTDISELLAPAPGRRQDLPGFDADYVDFPDYIVRCTHRIWEGKNLGLIRTHYTDDCRIYTLSGEIHGVEAVISGTLSTLQSFPDRTLYADQVIWSEDAPGSFYSSHRITSHMTHLGANELGPPSGRRATIRTIADCAVRANRIYEEWLVRDNWLLAVQVGADPTALAAVHAERDRSDPSVREFWSRERERTVQSPAQATRRTPEPAADPHGYAQSVFGDGWNERNFSGLAAHYSPTVEWYGPAGRQLFGAGAVVGFCASLLAAIPDAVVSVDHVAAVPFLDLGTDVAVRWSLAGTHTGPGLHGAASGNPVYLLAVTHWRICDGKIVEEWTVYDEIALLRQLLQGRP